MVSPWQVWAGRQGAALALPVPHVVQSTAYTCGPACLLAVAAFFGIATSEKEIASLAETTTRGTAPDKLTHAAHALGLPAQLVENMTLADLDAVLAGGGVAILALQAWAEGGPPPEGYGDHWSNAHFVIAVGQVEGDLLLEDPLLGPELARLSPEQLVTRWHHVDDRLRRGLAIVVRGGDATPTTAGPHVALG